MSLSLSYLFASSLKWEKMVTKIIIEYDVYFDRRNKQC